MIYGCIAEKLGHSFSKDIHSRLADYSYELQEIPKELLGEFMTKKQFRAINVTIPYKQDVIPYLDSISDVAKEIGAVNTIVNENGFLKGYNTDFSGMTALMLRNGISLDNKKVLILGSGGTSKTALAVAKGLGCKCAYRVSRNGKDGCIDYADAHENHSDAQVIINTTPVGMYPKINNAPINLEDYPKVEAVVDAVYNPLRSRLVIDAMDKEIKSVGGLYMLVAQAVDAAKKFLDSDIPTSEIDRVFAELMQIKQNIVLTGMPGSGKSTIGKILAEKLGFDFYDTDKLIEHKTQKTIPEIFAECGEDEFRKIESEVIFEISSVQGAVIATGGGAILNNENIKLLRQNGRIYFIDRNLDDIVTTSDRPLSSTRADLEKRYNERYDLYTTRCDRRIAITNDAFENASMIERDYRNEIIGN